MSFVALAQKHLEELRPRAGAPERAFREEAWRQSQLMGLPGRKTETWKYSSLASLEKQCWSLKSAKASMPTAWSGWLAGLKKDFATAAFVNGEFLPAESSLSSDVYVEGANFEDAFFRGEDGFSQLNAALANPCCRLSVRPGAKVSRPLVILNYEDSVGAWLPRFHQIRVGAKASLDVIEIWAGGAGAYLRTELVEADVAEGAKLNWVRFQREGREAYHFNETQVRLASSAALHFTQVNRGARWYRGQMQVALNGRHSSATVHGLTFLEGEQQMDQRVVLSHHQGESESQQLFKGVFKEKSRGTLNGKIFIARDAQKVNSLQMNHNLLLSPGAEANTKPELEIYADDVKANHGATVGRLDEEEMFYLRSRGLSAATAESLLSEAFAGDIYMKIPIPGARELVEVNRGP